MKRGDFVPGGQYCSKKQIMFIREPYTPVVVLRPGQACTFIGWKTEYRADMVTDYPAVRTKNCLFLFFNVNGEEVYTHYEGAYLVPAPLENLHPGASPRELQAIKLEKNLLPLTKELQNLEAQLESLLNRHQELQSKIAATNLQIQARRDYGSDTDFMTATIKSLGPLATPEKIAEIATALSCQL